ncbi:unnamed protein product, partial [Brachionus calyciflorus]
VFSINKREVQKQRRLRDAREESITNLDRAIVEQTILPQTSIQNSSSNETTNTIRIANNEYLKKSNIQPNQSVISEDTADQNVTQDSISGMMRDDDYLNNTSFSAKSTASFWVSKGKDMPNLKKLACLLHNMPSSSAFIERFYSICGGVCKKNSGNMAPNTIIKRSVLKANINLLEKLIESLNSLNIKVKCKNNKNQTNLIITLFFN